MLAVLSPGTELRRFRKGVMPKVAVAVLLFIPLIYGALYLWAFWAPTDELKNLPVALVNEDVGAINDGERITAGTDVVDNLVDGHDLDWQVTDAADASRGVADGDYYFSVTIPANFSANAISVGTDTPESATVEVDYNDSNNFLASTLGGSAMTILRDSVAVELGAQTADALLVGLNDAGDGIRTAADGATTLADGLVTAHDGAGKLIVGLGSLADGAVSLDDGAAKLADGASTLSGGLATLNSGSATLAEKSGELSAGAATLAGGMQAAADGAATLSEKSQQLTGGATALADGTAALAAGTGQVSGGIDQLLAAMEAAPAGTPASAFLPSVQKLQAGATELTTQTGAAAAQVQGYAGLSAQFTAGVGELSDKLAAGAPGAQQLAAGAAQLSDGAGQLASGVSTAASGAGSLSAGAAALSAGTGTLVDGSSQLVEGGSALNDGAAQLADGSRELADKLSEGGDAVPVMSDSDIETKAGVFAEPVVLEQSWQNEAKSFGEGFAPFFIALATFVGALITWLILRALPARALAAGASGIRAVMTGFLPAVAIGLGQVVIMMLVLVYGIGLEPVYWLATSAFIYLATLTFLALQQMFIILLGTAAGRVVSLVLLMLMLSSSGGTYPVETTPEFFQALHPWMPASYVVSGLRELITGGVDSRLWLSVLVLVGILVGSLAISAWSAGKQRMWTVARLHPELSI
ncbi:MAG: YhgE/Pip domain-containing protein [Microterricola sp.]